MTGGAGFIGSHLIDRLISRGDDVVVIDNLSSGQLSFIEPHLKTGKAVLVQGDLCNPDDVNQAMAMNIDCVFHLAANPDIRLGTRVTDTDLKQGTIATYNVLEAMRSNGVVNIAFASSSVVYGEDAPMPTPEDHGPMINFTPSVSMASCALLAAGPALVSLSLVTYLIFFPFMV